MSAVCTFSSVLMRNSNSVFCWVSSVTVLFMGNALLDDFDFLFSHAMSFPVIATVISVVIDTYSFSLMTWMVFCGAG